MVIIQKKPRIKSSLTVIGGGAVRESALAEGRETRPPPRCERQKVNFAAPDRADWVIDRAQQQATNNYRDYAIVTRFTDTNTGKIAIVAAGVGRGGDPRKCQVDRVCCTPLLNRQLLAEALWVRSD